MVVCLENLTQPLRKRQYFKFPYMSFYDQNEGFHVVLKGGKVCSPTDTCYDIEELSLSSAKN